jgi:hypothetical protein
MGAKLPRRETREPSNDGADRRRDRRGEETVTVPAGTFKALKLVYRNKRTGVIRYEAWYSIEVKQLVKLREKLETGLRVRELIGVRSATR